MWTGTFTVIAFGAGFLFASLLACSKTVDGEMEMMRSAASFRDVRRGATVGGPSSHRVMSGTGVVRSPYRHSDKTGIVPGRLSVLDHHRRVEAT